MRNLLKRNQVIIYVIALMLVTAGYLSYNTYYENDYIETSSEDGINNSQTENIGDATLVNSDDVVTQNNTINNTNTVQNIIDNTNVSNTTKENQSTEKIGENKLLDNENKTKNTNIINNTVETNSSIQEISSDYFVKSKLERDKMYSQMIETYENVLNSTNSLETQKQTATQEITKINETKNKIMICENLIKTKGFENNIIFVNGESISVIVQSKEIKKEEVAQIQNIISREMNAKIDNIHIANK